VPPHAFALDEGALTGATFRRERGQLALRELHSMPVPAGTLGNGPLGGPVNDAGALAATVSALVRRFARPPRAASLVLPDAWARGLTVELGALPERDDLRAEILRFRLKRMVPFRVEELRVAAAPMPKVTGQEDPVRALVLFAAESLCAALESAFSATGTTIGQIVNATLARLGAVAGDAEGGLTAVASVEPAGFALVIARQGVPLVWRQKSFADGVDENERAPLLAAELRLTRTFVEERIGGQRLGPVMLAAPPGVEAFWSAVLAEGLGTAVVPFAEATADGAAAAGVDAAGLGPLLGATSLEVA